MALSFNVTPGYSFSASEKVTYPKLNLLGSPVIQLDGQASSAQIADGSITTAKLASTIDINSKIADHNIDLDKLASGTHGQILYYDANGDLVTLDPGTDGKFLKTKGPGVPPEWAAQAGLSSVPISLIVAGGNNTQLVTNASGTVAWEAATGGALTAVTDPFFVSMEGQSGTYETKANTVSGAVAATPTVTNDTSYTGYNADYDGEFTTASGVASRETVIGLHQASNMAWHDYCDVSVPLSTFTAMLSSVTDLSQISGALVTFQCSGIGGSSNNAATGAFYKLGSEYVPVHYSSLNDCNGYHVAGSCMIPVNTSLDLRVVATADATILGSSLDTYAQSSIKITHLLFKA